jgi:hypothetical protein
MALIPLGSGRFADDPDTRRGVNAMRHQNSVFHGVLKHLPWSEFDRLVAAHGAASRVRRLTTKSQLVALLYGQLSGASSLREIVTGLESHAAWLYHLGAGSVRRSTLSDANTRRPVAVFAELLARLMQQAHRGLRRKLAETTYLIDATSVRLNERSAGWARFATGVCGAKVHVIYDANADRPIYAAVSAAKVNDITMAQQMPIEPGATYVFDLGYYDYAWWARLDAAMPDRHPLQSQHAACRGRRAAGAGGWQRCFRPRRLPPRAPSQEPPQSDAGRGARGAGHHQERQGVAPAVE